MMRLSVYSVSTSIMQMLSVMNHGQIHSEYKDKELWKAACINSSEDISSKDSESLLLSM